MLGTAPMPIWSVAPSPMKLRARSAMARSISSGGGAGRTKGAPSASTITSTRSRSRVLMNSGPSEPVRGSLGFTSTTRSRSGSAPASCSSSNVAPRCRERLTVPSGPGGAAWAVITLGA